MTRAVTKTLLAATILVAAHGFALCEELSSRIVKWSWERRQAAASTSSLVLLSR